MFTSSESSLLLDYLRVPTATLDLESRSSILRVDAAGGRFLAWPKTPAPGPAPERRLGKTRLFAPVLDEAALRRLLPDGDWRAAEAVVDAAGEPVGRVLRDPNGNVALPFSPDAALVNLWSEAYQAGSRSAGAKRVALLAYYRLRPFLPRAIQIVSDTSTESVLSRSRLFFTKPSKFGLPISSSSSQMNLTLSGTPLSTAYFAASIAVSAGPLSSVVPRPS